MVSRRVVAAGGGRARLEVLLVVFLRRRGARLAAFPRWAATPVVPVAPWPPGAAARGCLHLCPLPPPVAAASGPLAAGSGQPSGLRFARARACLARQRCRPVAARVRLRARAGWGEVRCGWVFVLASRDFVPLAGQASQVWGVRGWWIGCLAARCTLHSGRRSVVLVGRPVLALFSGRALMVDLVMVPGPWGWQSGVRP